jgi:hypothetical protein
MTSQQEQMHRAIMEDALKDPSKEPSKLYRWFIGISGLLVIGIFLLVYLGNGQSLSFIEGRAKSSTISSEYVLKLENGREVHFTKSVYDSLVLLLRNSEGNEFKACLLGQKDGTKYEIDSFYIPKVYGRGYDHVIAELCNEKTLIPLHSHPIDNCVFSDQDLKSYEQFKSVNPDALMGLMCSVDRFSFYG